jgi:hypothetical protein
MIKAPLQSRRDLMTMLGSTTALALFSHAALAAATAESAVVDVPYTVADVAWPRLLGNHRVRIRVAQPERYIRLSLPWRRVDARPEQKALLLFDVRDSQVPNVTVITLTADEGQLVFEAKDSGDYFLYYLPQAELEGRHSDTGSAGSYRKPEERQEAAWLRKTVTMVPGSTSLLQLPEAQVMEFEARTALDSFYPMEVPATAAEQAALLKGQDQAVLLFPEDRDHPIKMTTKLPVRWVRRGPGGLISGVALRNEYFAFQIGVFGSRMVSVGTPIVLSFEDLIDADGERIVASAFTCVNTNGIDPSGNVFENRVEVAAGRVTPLWCGIRVPMHAKPGVYAGRLQVHAGSDILPLAVVLKVEKDFIRDGGSDQPAKLARLQWLNSTIGRDNTIPPPYIPLTVKDTTVLCLGRKVQFGDEGFPVSIKAADRELLQDAIALKVYLGGKAVAWKKSAIRLTTRAEDKVVFNAESEGHGITLRVRTIIEFDGGIGCDVSLMSDRTIWIEDIALEVPYRKDAVPFAVGMGLKGGRRPAAWSWRWTEQHSGWKEQGSSLDYFLWLGDVHAGLYCRLKGPLDNWRNEDKGEIRIVEEADRTLFRARTGSRNMRNGEELHFSFRLLATPVKPLTAEHWKERYAHVYQAPADLHDLGATVINLHQGTMPNLFINYPFLNLDLLVPYVSEAHVLGMKVKLYYTMRELTTRLPELWTFRSLGDEIYRHGGTQGQGDPQLDFWLQEHLHDPYIAGWITPTSTGEIDTSLRVHSNSRLANFYLEGLRWLLDSASIDGLYLDEIGYSREIMQRVRRVLQRRPGAMIDMHGNHDWWSCNCPIGYYMEHLPYIDRLWLGEAFDPESPPDFWLIEMSGLPFGLSSDLLENPNPWRGMLFGMTDRALYGGYNPTPIWRLLDTFGIATSTMIGWWEDQIPIRTNTSNVLATVYRNGVTALVAIASWSKRTELIVLSVDWKQLDIDEMNVMLTAPLLEGLQEARRFRIGETIAIPPGSGCLLLMTSS